MFSARVSEKLGQAISIEAKARGCSEGALIEAWAYTGCTSAEARGLMLEEAADALKEPRVASMLEAVSESKLPDEMRAAIKRLTERR